MMFCRRGPGSAQNPGFRPSPAGAPPADFGKNPAKSAEPVSAEKDYWIISLATFADTEYSHAVQALWAGPPDDGDRTSPVGRRNGSPRMSIA